MAFCVSLSIRLQDNTQLNAVLAGQTLGYLSCCQGNHTIRHPHFTSLQNIPLVFVLRIFVYEEDAVAAAVQFSGCSFATITG
jgi:hypothetical protein